MYIDIPYGTLCILKYKISSWKFYFFFSYCMRVWLPKICHPNNSNKVLIDFFYSSNSLIIDRTYVLYLILVMIVPITINTFIYYKQG